MSCGWLTGEIVGGIWGRGPVAKNGKGLRGCMGNPGVPGPKGPPRCSGNKIQPSDFISFLLKFPTYNKLISRISR